MSEEQKTDLKYLSQGEVNSLKDRFRQKIDNHVAKVVTGDMSDKYISAIRKYAISCCMNRAVEDLAWLLNEAARLDLDELTKRTDKNADPLFSKEQRQANLNAATSKFTNLGHGLLGGNKRRLYFELGSDDNKSSTELKITEFLEEKGYIILDYKSGYATDEKNKQKFRIGKLIKENRELAEEFKKDKTREVNQDEFNANEHLLVLSDRAIDIAYMSTRKTWKNCMSYDDDRGHNLKLPNDIEHGSIIAYLIKKDDPNIYNPLSRLLLKPYQNQKGDRAYRVSQIQGEKIVSFINKAGDIADSVSSNVFGNYQMDMSLYSDDLQHYTKFLTSNVDIIELLENRAVDYEVKDNGEIIINDDLYLNDFNLSKLPDLSNVTVNGDFICTGNRLRSLEGAPKIVTGRVACTKNNLTSLAHMPKGFEDAYTDFGSFDKSRVIPAELLEIPKSSINSKSNKLS